MEVPAVEKLYQSFVSLAMSVNGVSYLVFLADLFNLGYSSVFNEGKDN